MIGRNIRQSSQILLISWSFEKLNYVDLRWRLQSDENKMLHKNNNLRCKASTLNTQGMFDKIVIFACLTNLNLYYLLNKVGTVEPG